MIKEKVLIILGPTATGKSDLAVEIARKYNGEIISADSRQVYKGLDIGSGKITKKEMRGVTHHMLDIVSPKKVYTVAEYKKSTQKIIRDIIRRGKFPILCGGTAQYIDSLIYDIEIPNVEPNTKLRKELEKMQIEELQNILKKLDPKRFSKIDQKNPVRLIRAIEIATEIGFVPENNLSSNISKLYEPLLIGLDWPDEILKERIQKRLLSRIKKGMIKEGENLHKKGISYKRMESLGLEYRYIALFLKKEITKDEMISEIQTKSWQFVKRQRTWWKRNKNIKWFTPNESEKIDSLIKKFLK